MPRGDARIRTEDGALNQIAERLRSRRRVLKLTQETLCAKLATVSAGRWVANRKEIVHLEAGTRIVSDIELLMLAKALECSPCWLLTGETIPVVTPSALNQNDA
jgi:transcriptional regulator with XRE-family HTH domain